MPEPYYATADELRAKLKITEEAILPDDEATELLTIAEDLIDEQLGVRPINEDTGRKVDVEDESLKTWQLAKLRDATLEVAAVVFRDPGVESRQRARFVSGDVSVQGVYGPAYGERAEALLNASKLRVNTARMRGSGRRRCR